MRRVALSWIGAFVLFLAWAGPAGADPQSKAYSRWQFDGNTVRMTYTIAAREITRLPGYQYNPDLGKLIADELAATIQVLNNGKLCPANSLLPKRARPGYELLVMEFSCDQPPAQLDIRIQALFTYAGSHVHFARFAFEGAPPFEFLYTPRNVTHRINLAGDAGDREQVASNTVGEVIGTYIYLGFEHILIGVDHIAFLLTLLLMASRLRHILFIITGFTLGHSITLSLAVLELATPNSMLVEALIGYTIALVAIENIAAKTGQSRRWGLYLALFFLALVPFALAGEPSPGLATLFGLALFSWCYLELSNNETQALRLRPAVTTLFGLIHGFGFANVLLDVGLPQDRLVSALFGFNLGVELGQLAIVLSISVAGILLGRLLNRALWQEANQLLSALLCALGMFWFVQRSFF